MAKTKILIGAVLVVGAATPLLLQQRAVANARAEHTALLVSAQGTDSTSTSSGQSNTEQTTAADSEPITVQSDQAELQRLRTEVAALQAIVAKLRPTAERTATKTARSANKSAALATFHFSELRDAGQATGAALLETEMWAILHGDTNRMAQLVAYEPGTDMRAVQRDMENLQKEAAKGAEQMIALAHAETSEIRLLAEEPAEGLDRWLVCEMDSGDGTYGRMRIRVRNTSSGWKLVMAQDGQPIQEQLESESSATAEEAK